MIKIQSLPVIGFQSDREAGKRKLETLFLVYRYAILVQHFSVDVFSVCSTIYGVHTVLRQVSLDSVLRQVSLQTVLGQVSLQTVLR